MSQNVYQLLREDHRALLAGLEQILEHSDGNTAKRVKHFRNVKQMYEAHSRFEEQVFYPAARRATGLDAEVDDDMEAHDEARDILRQMDTQSPESSEFMDNARRLHANLGWHIDHEERALWNQTKEKLPNTVEAEMGDEYARRIGRPPI